MYIFLTLVHSWCDVLMICLSKVELFVPVNESDGPVGCSKQKVVIIVIVVLVLVALLALIIGLSVGLQ